jgi:hypothetical protein
MKNFRYLLNKIQDSKIIETPFPHIYIENFFDSEDFSKIINSSGVNTKNYEDNDELFHGLFDQGYKIIDFPGCINNVKEYNSWHDKKISSKKLHSACEGFGMTLRLMKPSCSILENLKHFIESRDFNLAIASKFNIDFDLVHSDTGLQKYLDGYEISPHPDIRKKALTYMININPHSDSEDLEHHTHYLQLKKEYKYIQEFWKANTKYDRCWIPWDWAETAFIQNKNNSLVMFSPTDQSIHAVKATYNHLISQRTQLYGNLWFNDAEETKQLSWEQMMIPPINKTNQKYSLSSIMEIAPTKLRRIFSKLNIPSSKSNYSSIRDKK